VSWWFQINQPDRLMAALADPANGWIVPGNVTESRFVRELLSEPRRMARFLIVTVPEIGDKPARQVIVDWIAAGCPIPGQQVRRSLTATKSLARTNVRAATPADVQQRLDPHAEELQERAAQAVALTPAQHRGLRHRFYGPGGGAAH